MTQVEIIGNRLKVEILGWHKLWAFKSRLEFPVGHVVGIRPWNKEKDGAWRGIRAPGTAWPGLIVAGTYHGRGEHVFYDVRRFDYAVVIELKDEWYARLIVEVADSKAALQLIPVSRIGVR